VNTPAGKEAVATALAHLEHGHRDIGLRLLADRFRSDPADLVVAHTMAVMGLWGMIEAGSADAGDLHLGVWASLLADPRFWSWFHDDASRRYQTPIDADTVDRSRERFRTWLAEQVLVTAGSTAEVRFAQELRAAEISATRGGVRLAGSEHSIPCGPLLAAELGLTDQIARTAKGLAGSSRADDQRAALLFSWIGAAVVLLDRGRVTEAIATAEDLRCPQCATTRPSRSAVIRTCHARCSSFERANPAYRGAAGRRRFDADAGRVLLGARLCAVTTAIGGRDPDVGAAQAGLRGVRALVRALGCPGELDTYLTGPFLARVDVLRRDGRLDDAIALLDAVPSAPDRALDGAGVGEVRRLLAALLAARGVAHSNDHDNAAGLADLRRARELHPGSRHVARNLAVTLANNAYARSDTIDEATLAAAADRLTEARGVCLAYLREVPADPEMTEMLEQVTEALGDMQNGRAVRAHEAGDHRRAVDFAEEACRLCPGRQVFSDNRTTIRQAARTPGLAAAAQRRDLDEMERILEAARRSHPRDADLADQLREVQKAQAVELNAMGVSAADRRELDRARRLFDRALRKDPSSETIRTNQRQVVLLQEYLNGDRPVDDPSLPVPAQPGPPPPRRPSRWERWMAHLRLLAWKWRIR